MEKEKIYTLLLLAVSSPFIIWKRKSYHLIVGIIIVLLPFYNAYFYPNYVILYSFLIVAFYKKENLFNYLKNDYIIKIMFSFFVYCLIWVPFVENIELAIKQLVDLFYLFLFYLVLTFSLKYQRNLKWLILSLVIGFLLSVFIQYMQSIGIEKFYVYSEEKLNDNTHLNINNAIIRYWGPFGNSLTFSSYLAIIGSFLFIFFNNRNKSLKYGSYIILVITFYSVVLTGGRNALLSLVIGILFYFYLRNKLVTIISILIFILFTQALYPLIEKRFVAFDTLSRFVNLNSDSDGRLQMWYKSLPIFLNNPLFGSGPGNLNIAQSYLNVNNHTSSFVKFKVWGHVENSYLTVLYSYGIVGFSFFTLMISYSIKHVYRIIKIVESGWISKLSNSLFITWIIILINMITNPSFVTGERLHMLLLIFISLSSFVRDKNLMIKNGKVKLYKHSLQ